MKTKMRIIKSVVAVGVLMAVLQSCGMEEGPSYDPALQLEKDLVLIDQFVEANNLTVEIDEDSQIRYIIDEEGDGTTNIEAGDTVFVDYELFLLDGTFMDTSIEQTAKDNNGYNANRDYEPYAYIIGDPQIIPGFQVSTKLMTLGGAGRFFIPSVFGYQNIGSYSVPPNANLNFNIYVREVRK